MPPKRKDGVVTKVKKVIGDNEPFDEKEHEVYQIKFLLTSICYIQEFSKWVRFFEPVFQALERKHSKDGEEKSTS